MNGHKNRHTGGRSWGLTLMPPAREAFNNQEGRLTHPADVN